MLIDRRAFLKSMGLVGASSIVGCKGAPLEKMYAYLTPPEDIVPGVAAHYATVCRACPAGCGILVKTREGRPIKLEGNPAHPVGGGRLCARGQAFIQTLYGRDRLAHPLLRSGGKLVKTSWKKTYDLLAGKLESAGDMGLITGLESGSFEDLVADLAGGFPGLSHVVHEPVALTSMATAHGILFGSTEVPRIDLGSVDLVVSLGADFLDAWVSPVELSRQWSERHAFDAGRVMRMEYLGPRRNLTATAADRWTRTPVDEIGPLALGLLWELIDLRRSLPGSELDVIAGAAQALGPRPGLSEEQAGLVKSLAGKLSSADQGLVLYGGAEVLTRDATAIHCAVLLMNRLTGSLGRALRPGQGYALSKVSPDAHALELIDSASSGKLDVLLVSGCNPAYTIPGVDADKLERAPLVVCLAHERSETTEMADVVIPVHHPLESWGDFAVSDHVHGIMQPVRSPIFETRHAGDVLIQLAGLAGRQTARKTYKDYVVDRWARRLEADPEAASTRRWERTLVAGGVFEDEPGAVAVKPVAASASGQLPAIGAGAEGGEARLVTCLSPLLHDGRGATQDWLLEVPDSVLQTAWEVPVEVAPDLARARGIATGDLVEISSPSAKISAAAFVNEDLVPGTVAMRMGGGRRSGVEGMAGGSAIELVGVSFDPRSGELATSQASVAIARLSAGTLVSVSGETDPGDRPLHMSVRESDAQEGRWPVLTRHGEQAPDAEGHVHGAHVPMPHEEPGGTRPDDNIVTLQEHPEHRWGLVVDLDRCTGCGACAVACYAENNVPVVGREQVGKGRELSWIRIENHVFGKGPEREMRFLPVMCQQCDQAPCETVCPVFASYHTPDGVNAQIYNRCIGTRYCANNCPYKVRRFNWLKWPREKLARQQLNPDVTVRGRGVMEKCTFCYQRIREVTNRAKNEGRQVRDGEIMPACAQTCPTGALSFGDFKKPGWTMSRQARGPRGYRLLDYFLNTRPGVVYLRRVLGDPEKD